jgi:hypothetical protein
MLRPVLAAQINGYLEQMYGTARIITEMMGFLQAVLSACTETRSRDILISLEMHRLKVLGSDAHVSMCERSCVVGC